MLSHHSVRYFGRQGVATGVVILLFLVGTAFGLSHRGWAQEEAPLTPTPGECEDMNALSTPTTQAESEERATPAAGELCVVIELHETGYTPNVITVPADVNVPVLLHNTDDAPHTFTIDDHHNEDVENPEVTMGVEPQTVEMIVISATPGTYYFYSSIPGDEEAGLFGYLIVEEGAEIDAEVATVTPPAND